MTRAPRIALTTYDQAPALAPDDRLLIPALAALGAVGEPVVWSGGAPWADFDAVVIRSCWDYHRRFAEFRAWLDTLRAARVPTVNSTTLIDWNTTKRYLFDLAARGVTTLPTEWLPRGAVGEVERIAAANGWTRAVLKPAISASGHDTHLLDFPLAAPVRDVVARVTAAGDALLQPFAGEIVRDGELSLVFIDGAFSHAARKRVGRDFRVQVEHGGTAEPETVSEAIVAQARRAVRALSEVPAYARVDGIVRQDEFVLMELELIEPHLFLGFAAGAAPALARAIVDRVASRGATANAAPRAGLDEGP
jgi:glutathione synthase/RimK-type ligase-like ATP-grasp enzyme